MAKGIKGMLHSIRILREVLPQSLRISVFQALVESHLRYGNMMSGHLPQTKLCTVQKLQNRASYLIEPTPIKNQIPFAWRNIEKLVVYEHAVMVHKILKEILYKYIYSRRQPHERRKISSPKSSEQSEH